MMRANHDGLSVTADPLMVAQDGTVSVDNRAVVRVGNRKAAPPVKARRLAIFGLSMLGLLVALYAGHWAASDGFAYDAHAYWNADPYLIAGEAPDAFRYTPPALLAARVLHELPWPVFLEAYSLLIAVGVWMLAGPFSLVLVFTPQVASELTLGNVHVFLALVAVFGLRWPGLWAFALLTKVTPGVGLLWFAFRGEWRKLAIALGVTAVIAVPTMVLFPDLWASWLATVGASSQSRDGGPLLLRLPLAVVILWIGARRDWPWVVPVAAMLGLPTLWSVHGLSMLLGVVWWLTHDHGRVLARVQIPAGE